MARSATCRAARSGKFASACNFSRTRRRTPWPADLAHFLFGRLHVQRRLVQLAQQVTLGEDFPQLFQTQHVRGVEDAGQAEAGAAGVPAPAGSPRPGSSHPGRPSARQLAFLFLPVVMSHLDGLDLRRLAGARMRTCSTSPLPASRNSSPACAAVREPSRSGCRGCPGNASAHGPPNRRCVSTPSRSANRQPAVPVSQGKVIQVQVAGGMAGDQMIVGGQVVPRLQAAVGHADADRTLAPWAAWAIQPSGHSSRSCGAPGKETGSTPGRLRRVPPGSASAGVGPGCWFQGGRSQTPPDKEWIVVAGQDIDGHRQTSRASRRSARAVRRSTAGSSKRSPAISTKSTSSSRALLRRLSRAVSRASRILPTVPGQSASSACPGAIRRVQEGNHGRSILRIFRQRRAEGRKSLGKKCLAARFQRAVFPGTLKTCRHMISERPKPRVMASPPVTRRNPGAYAPRLAR